MLVFDKKDVRDHLTKDHIFELIQEFGGDPIYTPFGFISSTICHNPPGEGSRKLYFYSNSNLFHCFTGCADPSFDIFQLVIKVADIQWHKIFDLNDAVRWVAQRFGMSGREENSLDNSSLEDWQYIANYERIQDIEIKINNIVLKEYDDIILSRFNYDVKILPWLNEGIEQEIMNNAQIGYYPGGDQITIPHFDKDSRFIGLRGRTLCAEEGEMYGKYRPIKINKILYNHPLGMNLYGLNWNKDNIKIIRKAIIFESEKSVLLYASYFGWENNISVACCGSSVSSYQIQLLLESGAEEIIIAFDRQFQKIGDEEFNKLKKNLLNIKNKYQNDAIISLIFDKNMITDYKASPIDEGKEKFLQLFKERIIL